MSTEQVHTEGGVAAATTGVFARDATGLVREVSPFLAGIFNFSNAPVGLVIVFSAIVGFGYFSGGSILLGILIALLGSVPVLLNYAFLSSSMPRSGGDYVYVSRLVHPAVGFGANFGLTIFQIIGAGAVSVFFTLTGVVPAFATIANITGIRWFESAATWAGSATGSFLVAVLVLTLVAVLLARGTAVALRVNSVVWGIGLFSLLIMLGVLATTTHSSFVSRFNSFARPSTHSADPFTAIIAVADRAGFTMPGGFPALWGLIAVGMFGAGWFFWSTYIGGEIKGARQLRSTIRVMLSGQLVNGVLYLAAVWLILRIFGPTFIAAITWLLFNDPSKVPFFTGEGAQVVFFTALSTNVKWIAVIFVLTFIAWGWPLLVTYSLQIQRCVFAWSFDQLMPARLCEVNPRTHTPLLLIGVAWIMSVGAAALASYTGLIVTIYASTFIGTALYSMLVSSIAAMRFPHKGKDIYSLSPVARLKIGNIPLIILTGLWGVVFTVFWGLAYIFLAPFGMQADGGALLYLTFGLFFVGLGVYYLARSVRMRQGVPMDLVYAEVPPE